MKYIILSFSSRTNLQYFIKILQQHAIRAIIVNTPRKLSTSCGLSAKVDYKFYKTILNILQKENITGLSGVYLLTQHGLREQIEKLY